MASRQPDLSAADLRARFDEPAPMLVGLEEELMVLDGASLDLSPRGDEIVAAWASAPADADGPRLQVELPASQVEIATPPAADVPTAIAALAAGRRIVGRIASALGLAVAAAGTHPFAAALGALNRSEHYDDLRREHATVAHRQLVCALQVHVTVRGGDRALAVHDALRAHLPEIAALAANSPYHEGHDTGLASMRPLIAGLLPRQGIPPVLGDWETLADGLAWAGGHSSWWWDLRPHPTHGTLEVRVADAQTTMADAEAIATVVHGLVATLVERHDSGERLPAPETWRIAANAWSAARHGVAGTMRDLRTGEEVPTAGRIGALLDEIEPAAHRLGSAAGLEAARRLLEDGGGAARLRAAAGDPAAPDLLAATRWLAERFADPAPG